MTEHRLGDYLGHILEATRQACAYVDELSKAVEQLPPVLAEASGRVPKE
jgi:hypothetical protein